MELIKITMELLSPSRGDFFDKNKYNKKNEIFTDLINELKKFNLKWNVDELDIDINILFKDYKQSKDEYLKNQRILSGELIINAKCELEKYITQESKKFNDNLKKENKLSLSDVKGLYEKNFFTGLKKRVTDFILCINLAYPGLFDIKGGKISYKNNLKEEIDKSASDILSNVYFEQEELKISIINLLRIDNCWKWLTDKTNFFEGMGETPIDRALNAMSYLTNPEGYEEIFYAMIGLEALFTTDKSTSILEQMRRKVELIFGNIPGLRKKISNMYNIRSELMHGTLPFPSKYYINDATEIFEKFLFEDYMETVKIATILLVGTIQKFIINNSNQLVSEYKINFICEN